jgi:hypothetical protein
VARSGLSQKDLYALAHCTRPSGHRTSWIDVMKRSQASKVSVQHSHSQHFPEFDATAAQAICGELHYLSSYSPVWALTTHRSPSPTWFRLHGSSGWPYGLLCLRSRDCLRLRDSLGIHACKIRCSAPATIAALAQLSGKYRRPPPLRAVRSASSMSLRMMVPSTGTLNSSSPRTNCHRSIIPAGVLSRMQLCSDNSSGVRGGGCWSK